MTNQFLDCSLESVVGFGHWRGRFSFPGVGRAAAFFDLRYFISRPLLEPEGDSPSKKSMTRTVALALGETSLINLHVSRYPAATNRELTSCCRDYLLLLQSCARSRWNACPSCLFAIIRGYPRELGKLTSRSMMTTMAETDTWKRGILLISLQTPADRTLAWKTADERQCTKQKDEMGRTTTFPKTERHDYSPHHTSTSIQP